MSETAPWEDFTPAAESPWEDFKPATVVQPAAATAEPPPVEKTTWEKTRPYVSGGLDAVGGVVGGLLGAAAGTVAAPSVVINPVTGAVVGSGLGMGIARQADKALDSYFGDKPLTPTSPIEAARDVTTGMAYEMGGQMFIPPVLKAAGWMWDTVSGKMVQVKAGKILREIAGPQLEGVKQMLGRGAADTQSTAGQIVAGEARPVSTMAEYEALKDSGIEAPTFQALQRYAEAVKPEKFGPMRTAQAGEREASIRAVTPDLAEAEAARSAVSDVNYGISRNADQMRLDEIGRRNDAIRFAQLGTNIPKGAAISPLVDGAETMLSRPVIAAAREVARKMAANRGAGGADPMGSIDGLHLMKLALDNQLAKKTPGTALEGFDDASLMAAKTMLLKAAENLSPSYGVARKVYADMSPPVDQAKVLMELLKNMRGATTRETAIPFLNSLGKNEVRTLKKATGFNRYEDGDLEKVLTPDQMGPVTKSALEMVRDAKAADAATRGNTRLASILDVPESQLMRVATLNPKISLLKAVSRELRGKVNDKTLSVLVDAMASGKGTLEILNMVPTSQRGAVARAITNVQRGGTGALATLAEQQIE